MKSDSFRAAAESKDFSAVEDIFSEDVVFRSPAVFAPYEGRDAIKAILTAVTEVFEDFRYTDQVETGEVAVLVFEARVGDRELNGVDVLRFGADEKVEELMVMVRPLTGLQALAEQMGARLAEAAGSG